MTATSAFGAGILPAATDNISTRLVAAPGNEQLQRSEGSYRGFFTLTLKPETATAMYYAMRNVSHANLDSFASAMFVVNAGAYYATVVSVVNAVADAEYRREQVATPRCGRERAGWRAQE